MPRLLRLLPLLIAAGCVQPANLVDLTAEPSVAVPPVEAANPGEPGSQRVGYFTYGSGTDRRRAAFRDSVRVRTAAVNAAPFLRGMDPKEAKKRWRWWGFSERALPVNGRVWYPEGEGQFPLALIVHGNHGMKEFSDPGYEYLGRHLASRGFIAVSVDENFLNGGIRNENDARGWLLLKHLEAWRGIAADSASPVRGKVDFSRIALIGHSRGGEAVAVAAAFNRLTHHPDDARVRFHFGFDIRSIIAIAPVDGQYTPMDRRVPVRGVNYFVMHGSHDADVSSFSGQRTFLRTNVADSNTVRASLYVYRANHGQWNTVWGDNDVGSFGFLLQKGSLLSGEEQRRIGLVYFTGFLEMTMLGRRELEPMFRDYRAAAAWLPATAYVSDFASAQDRVLATFDDDIDVTTGAMPGVRIGGEGLALWREELLPARWSGTNFANGAALLGWRRDTASTAAPAWYRVAFTPGLLPAVGGERSAVSFRMMDLRRAPTPLAAADTAAPRPAAADSARPRGRPARGPAPKEIPKDSLRVDLTVQLELVDGRSAALPLSAVATLRPPLTIRLFKQGWIERRNSGGARDAEYVLQRVEIPLARFAEVLPGLDPAQVQAIAFRFDRTPAGTVYLDDVGFVMR